MNKNTVILELRRVADLLAAESVSRSQFQRHATISSVTVEEAFGSWNEAIVAAGLVPLPQGGTPKAERRRPEWVAPSGSSGGCAGGRIPDRELLDDLLRVATELGRQPSGNQVAAKGKFSPSVYQRRWGSVAAAYEAAVKRPSG
jgi:hypothetical protein